MIPVDLLMFDLDGTLIDSRKDLADSVNRTFREIGIPEKPRETLYGYVGNGVRRLISDAVGDRGPSLVERAHAVFQRHYLEHLLDETRIYPGMPDVLDHFSKKKKAVVTNKPVVYTTRILLGLSVNTRFDLVVAGEDSSPLKPHPEMILRALRHFGVSSDRAVMIGDSVNDIRAARDAGVRSCAVGYGIGDPEELKRAGPDLFSETVRDLTRLFC
jgi:phosphoglycolate phosphatase